MHGAVLELTQRDELLGLLLQEYGLPPLWQRSQSFATLVHIILEQKVSLASARSVMRRLRQLCPAVKPDAFLQLECSNLRQIGFSVRKISYCQSLAEAIVSGELKLTALRRLSDEQVIDQLTAIRGIGPWSAGVYLMMALRRPDAWASGDRALLLSYAHSAGLQKIPKYEQLDQEAERWRPYRSAAARLLWHAYLCRNQPAR